MSADFPGWPKDRDGNYAPVNWLCDRAVTLTQPWSTLMYLELKRIETRGRACNYRGWVGIHAAKGYGEDAERAFYREPFHSLLVQAGYKRFQDLPFGVVLCVLEFTDCIPTEHIKFDGYGLEEPSFGDYTKGRYGILTRNVRKLKEFMPVRGSQPVPWRLPRVILESELV